MGSQAGAGRRLSLITIDQIVSGASNLLIALLSAHLLGTAAFGYFGLILVIYAAAQGVTRSLVGDPLLVHPEDARARVGLPVSSALLLGTGMGGLILLLSGVLHLAGLPLAPEMLILGVAFPGLILHDLGRYLGFAVQRPSLSLVLDLAWLVLSTLAFVVLIVRDDLSLTWFTLAWVAPGALSSLLVFVQHRVRLGGARSWLRERWGFSWRFLMSFLATQGAILVFSVTVAAVAGAFALGAVRGALLLIRPYVTFQTAAVAAGVSEIANDADPERAGRHLRRTTLLALSIGVVNVAFLMLLPDTLGELVLADTWYATEPLLAAASLQIICLGLIAGPRSYLTGMRAIRTITRLDVTTTFGVVAAGTVGVFIDGALGAYWGTAIGQGVVAAIWWTVLRLRPERARMP